jgi:hypothetical protein
MTFSFQRDPYGRHRFKLIPDPQLGRAWLEPSKNRFEYRAVPGSSSARGQGSARTGASILSIAWLPWNGDKCYITVFGISPPNQKRKEMIAPSQKESLLCRLIFPVASFFEAWVP